MNQDEIFATIRTIYERQRTPVEIWKIYKNIKEKPSEVRNQLKILHSQGKIRMDVGTLAITPVLSDEEITIIEDKKNYLSEQRVRDCIRVFFREKSQYPTSSQIIQKFIEMIGVPAHKDPDRYIRKLFEDGKLKRDADNRYYFDGIESSNIGLRNFMV